MVDLPITAAQLMAKVQRLAAEKAGLELVNEALSAEIEKLRARVADLETHLVADGIMAEKHEGESP